MKDKNLKPTSTTVEIQDKSIKITLPKDEFMEEVNKYLKKAGELEAEILKWKRREQYHITSFPIGHDFRENEVSKGLAHKIDKLKDELSDHLSNPPEEFHLFI